MKVDIKLRRLFEGQDQWGMFIEEIGVDENGLLRYRATEGGNCEIGEYLDWYGEEDALEFILGFIPKSELLISELRKEISNRPTLKNYEIDSEVNYGGY